MKIEINWKPSEIRPGLMIGSLIAGEDEKLPAEIAQVVANNEGMDAINNAFKCEGTFGHSARRKLATSASDFLAERDDRRPVWVRSPKGGVEHYSGFTRSKLYELAGDGKIRSVSIREPGQVKGVRLFNLQSILDFVARCEGESK